MIQNKEQIKAALDPIKVLVSIGYPGSKPKQSGREIRDYCPIHGGDNGQNLCINIDNKLVHCKTCGFSGDIIKLYQTYKGIDFISAAKELADLAGIEVEYIPAIKVDRNEFKKRTPQEVIDLSSSAGNHPYLERKKVKGCDGLRFGEDEYGNYSIVIPLYDINGKLQAAQYVHEYGVGKYFRGSPNGAFFSTMPFKNGDKVYLAEGIATALTIWDALSKKFPVISFGSAFNLVHVVKVLIRKYPNLKIVLCLDNDSPAFREANEVKIYPQCSFRIPSFDGLDITNKPKDFNDLVSKCNQSLDIVCKQLEIEQNVPSVPNNNKQLLAEEAHRAEATTEATKSTQATTLRGDIELEIIGYVSNKSLNNIVDDGLDPSNFDPSLFSGNSIKSEKSWISINRVIIETISHLWDKNPELSPSITEIALNSGIHEEQVYKLLTRKNQQPVSRPTQIKERLERLQRESILSHFEMTLNKIKSDKTSDTTAIEKLSQALEWGRSQTNDLHSDDHYLADDLQKEEEDSNTCIPTEFADFNLLLKGGLKGGKLIVFTGKAGAGKSTFMIQMRDHIAKNGNPTVFVTMEQTRSELREISLTRIRAAANGLKIDPDLHSINEFRNFSNNLFTVVGSEHVTLGATGINFLQFSQIKGYVLNVIKQTGKQPVLFIDPFQRLSTGYKELDASEYEKFNCLVHLFKHLAQSLNITVIMASDVTKDHESNSSGEGSGRGTYMIQHQADLVGAFKESERHPYEAMFGELPPSATGDEPSPVKSNSSRGLAAPTLSRKQKMALNTLNLNAFNILNSLKTNSDIWVSIRISKNRGGELSNLLFIHERNKCRFKESTIWSDINQEDNNQ